MQRSDDPARRELLLRLAALPLFSGLDAHTLSDLADTMEWLALPGGAELFGQDEPSDALYVLVHGRLSAQRRDEEGCMRALGAVMPGECVGETGLIAGVHNENDECTRAYLRRSQASGVTDYRAHTLSRPPITETLAIAEVYEVAADTGCLQGQLQCGRP